MRLLLLAVLVIPVRAAAQAAPAGSRILPLGHWTYEYLQRLRVRGHLTELNPLAQPYRRAEVARAVQAIDLASVRGPVTEWVSMLRRELAGEARGAEAGSQKEQVGLEVTVGGRASSSQRLDPARPLGDSDAWPRFTAGAWLELGPFAAESRLLGDVFLTDDPDGIDPGQRRGARTDHAYVSASFGAGAVTVGRLKNNWAPLGQSGLMISGVPTSYPQLALELGSGRLRLRSLLGELDTLRAEKRYVAAHRLDYTTPYLTISIGEATVYASRGSAPWLRYLNPVEFFFFDQENQPADVTPNLMIDGQVWYGRPPIHVFAEVLLDDIDVIPAPGADPAPLRYALRLGLGWTPRSGPLDVRLSYQQVASYAYRTFRAVDHYSFLGRGLGENYSDHDRLALDVEFAPPVRGLLLQPGITILRQGEGDFRDPMPSDSAFRASPALLLGTTETTYRLAIRGRYQPNRFLWLRWDAGQNLVRNAQHLPGNLSKFAAVLEVGASIGFPLRRQN